MKGCCLLLAAASKLFWWPRTAGQGAGAEVSAGGVEMKQRRRSRLRSCRAESCAGALDATGGVTHPRHRRGQRRRRWCGERSSPETRWVPSPAVVVRLLEERSFTPRARWRSNTRAAGAPASSAPGGSATTAAAGWLTWSTSLSTTAGPASTSPASHPTGFACRGVLAIRRLNSVSPWSYGSTGPWRRRAVAP